MILSVSSTRMNSIRVNGLSRERSVEELKVYFSKPRNGGGRIRKIYYPLLNNDAVIVYEDEDVATQVLSLEEHDVFGDMVEVLPLPINIFTEIYASLDPGVASMIKTTHPCEDRLRYICEVDIVTDNNHNICLRGDVYQIEMAWKVISQFLHQQRQIHSSVLSSTEKLKMQNRLHMENGASATSGSRARRRQRQEESRQTSLQSRSANGGSHLHERSDSFEQNGKKYSTQNFDEEGMYESHKYASRGDDKPKITPRRSLQNDGSRPLTQPGAEASEREHLAEIERIMKQTQEEKANRSTNSSVRSNDSMSKIGPSQLESIDIPPMSSHNHFMGQRETLHEYDYLSLGSRMGESHAFPQNHADSSGDESLHARGTGRLSDANETFEKFSSLKISPSPGQSDKKTSLSKRSNSKKETESGKSSSQKAPPYTSMETMNSVLKDTEKILRESNLAVESSISSYAFNIGHIKIRIYHGNITAVETAGLVNAANGSLANGAGVAGAIARAASPTMQQECDAYIKKFGILGTGEVMHTRAGGRLSASVSHIIHAVGPIWLEGLPDRCSYELTLTYLNVLKYAEKLWLPSVTLPCISSGIFGSPLDISIKCFLDALLLFVSESKKDYHLREVSMVNNDQDGVITTIALLQSLLETGQDLIMAQAIDRFTKLQEKRKPSAKVFSSTLSAKAGTKDDFHSLDYGKPSALMSTDAGKRRSSSLSRATGKTKMKDPESPRNNVNLESSRNKGSGLSVSGRNPGSTLDRSASDRSGSASERRSRLDSAGSSRSTTASRLSAASTSGAKNSPRAPPTMKQSLVTSPPGAGAKPKTKTNTSSRNVPMKANTLIPTEATNQTLSPRTEAAISKTSHYRDNLYENDVGLHSLPTNLHTGESDSRFLFCKICINEVRNPKTLYKCGHTFCSDCVDKHLRKNNKCPTCGVQYDKAGSASDGSVSARDSLIKSTQPAGTMSSITRRNLTVPGFEYCEGAIEIHYDIPSGKQGKYDPLPGQSYTGVQHKAYLPNSAEGREILRLLKQAFKANKVFRISGRGTIEWNISHKTKISSFSTDKSSYPDPLHLRRVREELSRKGIV